ncbi:MAG: hypothetical protein J7M25_08565 [Deltaproteobacteria bacterium]|nr:hypothetical protein [Deltaproteobacteria bacterium]
MLDAWVIEQIKRREAEEQEHREQPQIERPLDPMPESEDDREGDEDPKRGVVIVDFMV